MPQETRWRYRFTNFSRAYSLLREALEDSAQSLNQLEREGVIQRFEFTFELSWNLLKDKLEHDGIILPTITPRAIIRQAFQAKLIDDCETWLDMLVDRSLMSRAYDFEKFQAVILRIHTRYLAILDALYHRLLPEALPQ